MSSTSTVAHFPITGLPVNIQVGSLIFGVSGVMGGREM
jgi:hypothetical protein